MSLSLGQVSVATSATVVGILGPGNSVYLQGAASGGSTIWVGSAGTAVAVTSSNGYPILPGQAPVFLTLPQTSAPATLTAISGGTASAILGVGWVTAS